MYVVSLILVSMTDVNIPCGNTVNKSLLLFIIIIIIIIS